MANDLAQEVKEIYRVHGIEKCLNFLNLTCSKNEIKIKNLNQWLQRLGLDGLAEKISTATFLVRLPFLSLKERLETMIDLGRQGRRNVLNQTMKFAFSEKRLNMTKMDLHKLETTFPDVLTKVIAYLGQMGRLEELEFVNRRAGDYLTFAPDNWIGVIFDICCQCKPKDSPFKYLHKLVIHGSYGCEEQLSHQVLFILYLLKSKSYLPQLQEVIIYNLEKTKKNIQQSPYLLSPLTYITKATTDMMERMKKLKPPPGCKKFGVVELKGFYKLRDGNNNIRYKPENGFSTDEIKEMESQLTATNGQENFFRDLEDVYFCQMNGEQFVGNKGIDCTVRAFPKNPTEAYENSYDIQFVKVTRRSLNQLQSASFESLVARFMNNDYHCMRFKPQGEVQNYYSASRSSTLSMKDGGITNVQDVEKIPNRNSKAKTDYPVEESKSKSSQPMKSKSNSNRSNSKNKTKSSKSMKTTEIRTQDLLVMFTRELDGIRTLKHRSVINDLGLNKGLHSVNVWYTASNLGNFAEYARIVDYFCQSIEARENLQKYFLKELKELVVCIHYNYKYLIPRLYFHPAANVYFNYDREFFIEWMSENHPKKLASVLNHYLTSSESLLHTLLQHHIYDLPLINPENNEHLLGLKIHLLPQSILDIFYPLQKTEYEYVTRASDLLFLENKYVEVNTAHFRRNNTAKFYFCLHLITNFLCHRTFQVYDLMDPVGNFGRYEDMTCDIIVLRRYVNTALKSYQFDTASSDKIEELITEIARKRQSIDFFSDFCRNIDLLCDFTQVKVQEDRTKASLLHEEDQRLRREDSIMFPLSDNPRHGSSITGKSYLQHEALCGNLKSFTELQRKKPENIARLLFQDPEYLETSLKFMDKEEEKTEFKYFLPQELVPELPPIFILFRDFSLKELFFELAEEVNAEDAPFCLPSMLSNRSSAFKHRIKFNKRYKSRIISQWDCRSRRISHDFPLFVIVRNCKNSPSDVKAFVEYFGLNIEDKWIVTSLYTGDFPLLYICRNYQIGYLEKLGFFQNNPSAPSLLLETTKRYTTSKPYPSVAETIYDSDFQVLQNKLYGRLPYDDKIENFAFFGFVMRNDFPLLYLCKSHSYPELKDRLRKLYPEDELYDALLRKDCDGTSPLTWLIRNENPKRWGELKKLKIELEKERSESKNSEIEKIFAERRMLTMMNIKELFDDVRNISRNNLVNELTKRPAVHTPPLLYYLVQNLRDSPFMDDPFLLRIPIQNIVSSAFGGDMERFIKSLKRINSEIAHELAKSLTLDNLPSLEDGLKAMQKKQYQFFTGYLYERYRKDLLFVFALLVVNDKLSGLPILLNSHILSFMRWFYQSDSDSSNKRKLERELSRLNNVDKNVIEKSLTCISQALKSLN